MKWASFKSKFHPTWHQHMKPFIESTECDEIFKYLKDCSKDQKLIMPTSHNTFKAFEIPLDKINVVLLGGNPYDGTVSGTPVSNGLLLDCSNIEIASYEIRNFYRGLEVELFNGLSLNYKETYSIKYLTEQGVMMLNSALTTEEYKDHSTLWEPFTNHVLKILDKLDVPIVFMGKQASRFISQFKDHHRFFITDDIPGTMGKDWVTDKTFRGVDDQLEEARKETIMWLNIDCPF